MGPRERRLVDAWQTLGFGGPISVETLAHLRELARLRDLLAEIIDRFDSLSLGDYGLREPKDAELLQRARELL